MIPAKYQQAMVACRPPLDPEAAFAEMVYFHNLLYDYADDPHEWKRGAASLRAIERAAVFLPRARVIAIWNAEVKRKLAPGAWPAFLWAAE